MLSRAGKGKGIIACRAVKETLTKPFLRNYAVAAPLSEPLEEYHSKQHGAKGFETVKVTTLENGIKVVSMQTHVPLARVAVFTKAGSRYETAKNLGVSHALRNSALMTSKNRSALHVVRETAQDGATLSVTTSREHFIYSGSSLINKVPAFLENIASVMCDPLFYPWELKYSNRLTELDKAILKTNPQAGTLDILHGAAYRNGLGNSLFCPDDKIGSFTPEAVRDFHQAHFVGERTAVIGLGISHHDLVESVSKSFSSLPRGLAAATPKQTYHGGEVRQRTGGDLLHVAIAGEGVGLMHEDFTTLGVLQRILGVTPFIKWGSHSVSSRLNKAVLSASNGAFMTSAFNAAYSDSGLFGIYTVTEPNHAKQVLKAIVALGRAIAKGDFTAEELERAKNQMKASVLMSAELYDAVCEDIALQVMNKGTYTSPVEYIDAIDKITKEKLIAAAEHTFFGRTSVACLGDTSNAPYWDELL